MFYLILLAYFLAFLGLMLRIFADSAISVKIIISVFLDAFSCALVFSYGLLAFSICVVDFSGKIF